MNKESIMKCSTCIKNYHWTSLTATEEGTRDCPLCNFKNINGWKSFEAEKPDFKNYELIETGFFDMNTEKMVAVIKANKGSDLYSDPYRYQFHRFKIMAEFWRPFIKLEQSCKQ